MVKKKTPNNLALMCRALGNPIRMRIFKYLKDVDKCICGEIVDMLPIAQATVSQHIKVLKEAGLVKGTICGPSTCYCIDKEALKELKKMVKEF